MPERVVYIAGPMRGFERFNFPAFDAAASQLRAEGWDVRSPAEHDRDTGFDETRNSLDGFDLEQAMRWDLAQILDADAVYLLPGWEKSSGVAIELSVARAVGADVMYAPGAEPRTESVAEEAHRLVHGDRQAAYGHPADDFARTGRMWGAILGIPDVAADRVGLCMAAVKISRQVNAPKRDNLVDGCGYFLTVDLVHQRNIQPEEHT